jgi:sec-independent protein translocase protein TatB
MFSFSFSELILVAVIALIVLGPKQLPVIAQHLGLWLRRWRALVATVQAEINTQEKEHRLAENEARAKAADNVKH